MGRIKRAKILGVFFFILIVIGLGLTFYPKPKTQRPSPNTQNLKPITQYPTANTQNLSPNNQDTDLPIFRDLFKPLIKPSLKRPAKEIIEPAPPKTEQGQPPAPPPFTNSSLRLVGVVMGNPAVAILEVISTMNSHIARMGDTINNEEIVAIKEDSVVIKKEEQEITLMLWENK